MTISDRDPYFHRPEYFVPLRDKILEFLPVPLPGCLDVIDVQLRPIGFGDVELDLQHNPAQRLLTISTTETLYKHAVEPCGTLTKSCELDVDTATITGYDEQLELTDSGPLSMITQGDLVLAEADLNVCDTDTLRYFMLLLGSC